jgi:hypothetical protein
VRHRFRIIAKGNEGAAGDRSSPKAVVFLARYIDLAADHASR